MNKFLFIILTILLIGAGCSTQPTQVSIPKNMQITSSAFQNGEKIPSQYTCDGENVNPALQISDIPSGAKSLVLIVDDPDAPMGILRQGSGQAWVHWTMWNISPETSEISENNVPSGAVQGKTSFGSAGYGGPCPPGGTHRYFFKIYALDTVLNLPADAGIKELENAMTGHILEKGELIGLYSRKK